jgi:quercetin dioxygenase-like cupin family protein
MPATPVFTRTFRSLVTIIGCMAVAVPISGISISAQTGDALSQRLERRVVQRGALSIPGREFVQVETVIPAGVESGWHVHPGEEVGFIAEGEVEMKVQGRADVTVRAGEGFVIPPRTAHNARDLGPRAGRMLSTYIVATGEPLSSAVEPPAALTTAARGPAAIRTAAAEPAGR